ncbi:signal transduction histidine kinase/CheY-like chemotaxis protein [Duganella sp. 3397]|uniref:hybrid sensor histidine kinase/response regulator n=1 Tax=Duganella sp. 3397 TaxID=2817732 RepID=UPI00285A6AE2|nr:response regulator [Duganella sp. 3397]MDR7048992.1 signal transduction histidine kinase/CheY-like chemotaxis protein [Duganella sp. 3397]
MPPQQGEQKYVARLPTIRSQIYSLVWACALPAILGFALLTNNFIVRERKTIQQDTLITARALIQAVDRDLNTGITVALALANSPSIDNRDFAAFYRQATEVLRPEFPGYNFVLHDHDSVQLLNTARPYGELYPDPLSAARIAQVFQTGKPLISNLFYAGALKRPLAAIHAPVIRDGKVVYVISVAFVPERLGQVLREQLLPANRVTGIFDANGVLVARTHDPEKYVGQHVSPTLLSQFRLRQEDAIEATTLEGIPVYSMYSRSQQSGWAVVIGVPRSAVYAEVFDSITWIMAFLALVTAAGFGVAWHFARNIEGSVRSLTTAAMALGGKSPQQPAAPAAFHEAAQALDTLHGVESELLRYRHHLENLIEHRTRQLESAMREAQAANAAKDVFVANMSHELRTPMNAVLGVAHLLGRTGVTPEQARYLEMIRTSGQSLLGILNDILDLSKMQAGKVELHQAPFRLDDVLHAVATIMSVSAGDKQLELAIGVDADVPRALVGDALRLHQVLVNLAGNAIKFTERGEVSLRVSRLPAPGGATVLCFAVKDTGIGLNEEQVARLFSPFTQADLSTTRRFGGTGLGLTISRGLIELMQGQITVHSMPGEGSEFRFTVPLGATQVVPEREPHVSQEPLHLLLADDNATSRDCIAAAIAAAGWTCNVAGSSRAAVALLRGGTKYDAVLVDWQMSELCVLQPEIDAPLVCMLNAYGRDLVAEDMANGRIAACLTKPVTAVGLVEAVQAARTHVPAPARQDDSAQPPLAGVRILLVEDNPINQVVARGLLEQAGARVTLAENGEQAVAQLRRLDCDLVLMDVQMPVMDGFTATRIIREELRLTLPVIAMTAGVMASEREQCIAAGMDDFIGKPIDVEQMFAILARHLSRA